MRLERLGGDVPAGDLQAVELRDRLRQQALLEGQRGLPLGLEQHRVVDRDRHPAGDRADQVTVGRVVVTHFALGEPGQGQAHDAEQLTPGVQRSGDHRRQPGLLSGRHALRAGRRVAPAVQVIDLDRVQTRHRLLAEMALRIMNLLAHLRPGTRRRHPVARMPLHAADELVALIKVDEAVVGELRHEHLRHVLERGADLQRASQPLAHPLEQRQPVLLPLAVAFARLAGQDHHPVDVAARMPQGHRESADKPARPVAAHALERSLPRPAAEYLRGQILRLAHVVVGEQSERQH